MIKCLKSLRPVIRIALLVFVLFIALKTFLYAQEVQFIASAEPSVLRSGEQFTLTYEANQQIADISLPEFGDFQYLGGPSVGQSTQIESAPGKTYSRTTYSHTYYFRALKEGKFTVAPATAKIKNRNYQSNSITIEVVGNQASGSSASGQKGQTVQSSAGTTADNVYIRLLVNKKEAYVGEQILAYVKLYTKLQISGIDERYKGPDFTGFYTEQIKIPPLRNLERESIGGDIFYTGVLQKVLLIPQKTGELVIEPFDLDISVRQQVRTRSNNFFDEFFEPSVQDIPVKLRSNRVVINSKPLPASKPVSFTGAVGDFTLSSSIDKMQVRTNDAINFKVVIKGTGNYKIIDEPVISFPPDVEIYDPVIKTSSDNPLEGTKTFEYLLIPHLPGEFTISPVEFSFFDVSSQKFKTIHSSGFTIHVEKSEGDTLMPAFSGLAKEDVKLLRSDIQYIKLKTRHPAFNGKYLVDNILFYLIYAALFVSCGTILWIRRNHIRRTGDLTLVKNRKANQYARKRLKKAARMTGTDNKNEFYDELLKAIWLYLSDKLSIPIADLSRESARSALEHRNIKEDTMNELFEITGQCELARYAPASESVNTGNLLDKTVKLIVRLQQELS